MMTPTDRVRAALECITEEHQYIHGQRSFLKLQAKVEEIKRELEGMVLVPEADSGGVMDKIILRECMRDVDPDKKDIYEAAVYDVLRSIKKLGFTISKGKSHDQ
jgi:hypothetical protein